MHSDEENMLEKALM